jgi:hypothetical protein
MTARKLFTAIAALTCVAALAACSSSDDAAKPTTTTTATKDVEAGRTIPDLSGLPTPPEPETVKLSRIELPPPPTNGTCDLAQHVQGCVGDLGQAGGYIDEHHVTTNVTFAGAPGTPFDGQQLIVIDLDGTFSNGTPWKCLTCGIPAANLHGLAPGSSDYPQPFNDGKRVLVGTSILQCEDLLVSDACTPETTSRYPLWWDMGRADGKTGSMRELRIHPDGVHLGWSRPILGGTKLDQFMYYGRLEFEPNPTTGVPRVPRYDLTNVSLMYDTKHTPPIAVDPDDATQLVLHPEAIEIGEFRGWSKDGKWATYVGTPERSDWINVFRVNLQTGEVRGLERNPEYVDPLDLSFDGKWGVYLDTRGSGRQMFMSAMPGIPPLTDLITTTVVSSVRNEGERRFFQPILLDIDGDRGDYTGQALKDSCSDGHALGGLCDPNWNARADPHWSPDDTQIAYSETDNSTLNEEPGGRQHRLVLVDLPDRKPVKYSPPSPVPDEVPWATPYHPGDPDPLRTTLLPPSGTYTLRGAVKGSAKVTIEQDTTSGPTPVIRRVAVTYSGYSDDGDHVIDGTEEAIRMPQSQLLVPAVEWHSDLKLSGKHTGTKVTSPDGWRVRIDVFKNDLYSAGDLTTTIDGKAWHKPAKLLPF